MIRQRECKYKDTKNIMATVSFFIPPTYSDTDYSSSSSFSPLQTESSHATEMIFRCLLRGNCSPRCVFEGAVILQREFTRTVFSFLLPHDARKAIL